jgi:cold shock CspA family protein
MTRPTVRAFEPGTGEVASFDEARGLGTITVAGVGAAAGPAEVPFHCTAIADGTRTISVGERVRFHVTPGPAGRWEATHIQSF